MSYMNAEKKITKARAGLVMAQPFFGSLALKLRIAEDNTIKTTDCDGVTFRYNKQYIEDLTFEEVKGVMAQGVMHPAFLHHTRRGHRENDKWQQAADYSINGIIQRAGFALPKDSLVNPQYDGKTAEQIYTLIPDPPKKGGGKDGNGQGEGENDPGCCGVSDAPGQGKDGKASDSERKEQETEWKMAVAQAAYVAKQQGKLPADMERLIDELMEPELQWKEILRRFLTEKANDDFSWKRGNRRFLAQGLYLPSRESEATGDIVVCVDTSGSIGAKELNEFGSEIQGIIEEVKPRKTYVIYCDAAVNGEPVEFGPHDQVVLEARGGGGTDFRPPFAWLAQKQIVPKALVYLTDGYGSFPDESEVDFPTLWCINNDQVVPPLGEHLTMKVDR